MKKNVSTESVALKNHWPENSVTISVIRNPLAAHESEEKSFIPENEKNVKRGRERERE